MLWELLVFVAVIWMVRRRWLMRRQRALAKQLKTNTTSWPILGHVHKILRSGQVDIRDVHHILARDVIDCGGLSKLMYFDQLLICVADPELIQILMTECLEKHSLMKIIEPVTGNCSFIAPVPIWRSRRKVMLPSFNTKNVAQYFEVFTKQSTEMADLLERKVNKEPFSCWEYLSSYSLNSVCETTMGMKINAQSKFLSALEELWTIKCYLLCHPWFRYDFMQRLIPQIKKKLVVHRTNLWDFIINIIHEKRKLVAMKDNTLNPEAYENETMSSYLGYQLTLPEHQRFTQKELLEECLTVIIAGFDTTAITSSFTILNLSRHPDIQDKVYKELEEVFGESDRSVCQEDLPRLKYMEAVIKETLRLYPPVPNLARNLDKDIQLPSGLTLVSGCGLIINIWATHRNPAYWGPDAEQFRPKRFLDTSPKHPAAFIPFGYGPRSCIGTRFAMSSMKTTLSTLLRRYRVLPPPGVQRGEPLRTTFNMVLKHTDDYQIRLERRH